MLYLLRSYTKDGSILKIGYATDLTIRLHNYTTHNPGIQKLSDREGDIMDEFRFHTLLSGLGYKLEDLTEWYRDDPEVLRIFELPISDINDMLWENRDLCFPISVFKFDAYSYRENKKFQIYEELFSTHDIPNFGEQYIVDSETNNVTQIDTPRVDIEYRKILIRRRELAEYEEQEQKLIFDGRNFSQEQEEYVTRFRTLSNFKDKLKLYCEFADRFLDSLDLFDIKIRNSQFRKYYDFYGTSGCSARKFVEKRLIAGLKDCSLEDDLKDLIYSRFEDGGRYTLKEIKSTLSDFYNRLGISKTPKATDLSSYFKLTKTTVTLPDKSTDHGYKLTKKKE